MDVSVKVSLQGGHVWEFTCDEGDPMVFGLVSALPGASVDSALPPDGLVQVEARSGERMYLTRSSLVAVTINRLGHGASAIFGPAAAGERRLGSTVPSPFVLVPDCFDAEALADLRAAVGRARTTATGATEVELKSLPEMASTGLVAAIAEARTMLALVADEDTHLDIRLHKVDAGALEMPSAGTSDILSFLVVVPTQEGQASSGAIELHDHENAPEAAEPGANTRTVAIRSNAVLVFPAITKTGPLQLSGGAEALVISGSLRRGVAGGRP